MRRFDEVLDLDGQLIYPQAMLSEQLTQQLLELPLPERVALAQALWQSIDEGPPGTDATDEEQEALEQARKRDAELSSDLVAGRAHQQVMEAARRILECG